jgi:VanZ family protein
MRLIFSVLSVIYISGIFILPRVIPSSLLSEVWNPYSLLHIPLYGVLILLSFGTNLTVLRIVSPISPSFFVPGGIASLVGILDEIHQTYIPGRDSSITDVMLDITGITLTAIFVHFFQQRRKK